ncbi:MAG: hypothetical protein CME70_19460 [Halobacteriovorax sp.]|nr:hypothetical protein [Halobacteriovorax sp.]MBK26185.1 hypothetical protein [Halobacteriovorax sp.]|tara:strand:- start:4116 stop:4478 length:363 start_codon:yes stop_codon:yes gene_type:complete
MSTHAVIGIKFPDGRVNGCYVHYDGSTISGRIEDYLDKYTTTCLSLLILRAQATGGIRSFHCPRWNDKIPSEPTPPSTEFLDDNEPYVIDESNWFDDHYGTTHYRYLIDYETGNIQVHTR